MTPQETLRMTLIVLMPTLTMMTTIGSITIISTVTSLLIGVVKPPPADHLLVNISFHSIHACNRIQNNVECDIKFCILEVKISTVLTFQLKDVYCD